MVVTVTLKLIIGNKNYSSWSLRPYMALYQAQIPFEEEKISFNDHSWKSRVRTRLVPAKVPVLIDGENMIWDTIAILEYLAEKFPDRHLWPENAAARAIARSACAEMHSSYIPLRKAMPMNVTASFPGFGWSIAVQTDIDRICELWTECRSRFGADGPFLFGRFSNADAMFAPVVLRFMTHAVRLPDEASEYCRVMRGTLAMKAWVADAAKENEFVQADEPYRKPPTFAR
jgi:glutathione S-transferase